MCVIDKVGKESEQLHSNVEFFCFLEHVKCPLNDQWYTKLEMIPKACGVAIVLSLLAFLKQVVSEQMWLFMMVCDNCLLQICIKCHSTLHISAQGMRLAIGVACCGASFDGPIMLVSRWTFHLIRSKGCICMTSCVFQRCVDFVFLRLLPTFKAPNSVTLTSSWWEWVTVT